MLGLSLFLYTAHPKNIKRDIIKIKQKYNNFLKQLKWTVSKNKIGKYNVRKIMHNSSRIIVYVIACFSNTNVSPNTLFQYRLHSTTHLVRTSLWNLPQAICLQSSALPGMVHCVFKFKPLMFAEVEVKFPDTCFLFQHGGTVVALTNSYKNVVKFIRLYTQPGTSIIHGTCKVSVRQIH